MWPTTTILSNDRWFGATTHAGIPGNWLSLYAGKLDRLRLQIRRKLLRVEENLKEFETQCRFDAPHRRTVHIDRPDRSLKILYKDDFVVRTGREASDIHGSHQRRCIQFGSDTDVCIGTGFGKQAWVAHNTRDLRKAPRKGGRRY